MTGSQEERFPRRSTKRKSDEIGDKGIDITQNEPIPMVEGTPYVSSKRVRELRKMMEIVKKSPSAGARRRLQQLLVESKNGNEEEPDFFHDEIDIITSQERKMENRQVTLAEIFSGVVFFVDVRSGNDNRSQGIKSALVNKGLKVTDSVSDATHIIFRDGLKTTFEMGKARNLPFVTLHWVKESEKHRIMLHCNDYEPQELFKYQEPNLYKITRKRSMQPDASVFVVAPKSKRKRKPRIKVSKPKITVSTSTSRNAKASVNVSVSIKAGENENVTVVYENDQMQVSSQGLEEREENLESEKREKSDMITTPLISPRRSPKVSKPVVLMPLNSTMVEGSTGGPMFNFTQDAQDVPPKEKSVAKEPPKKLSKSVKKRRLFNPTLDSEVDEVRQSPKVLTGELPRTQECCYVSPQVAVENIFKKLKKRKTTEKPKTKEQKGLGKPSKARVIVTSNIGSQSKSLLKEALEVLEGGVVRDSVTDLTTHIIIEKPYTKTEKVMRGIIHGLWIVDSSWLRESLEKKAWVNEEMHEVRGFLPAITVARTERELLGIQNYKLTLLNNVEVFVGKMEHQKMVRQLVLLLGGKLVPQSKATYIIADSAVDHSDSQRVVSKQWITDSIGDGLLLSYKKFLFFNHKNPVS